MGGDFNAKNVYWGSRLTTTKGRELHKAMQLAGCDAVTTCKPTYWPTDSKKMPDLIDFFIVNKISRNFLEIEDSDYLNSDHSPIFLSLSENIIFKEHMDKLSNRFTDWHYFKKILQNCKNNAAQIVNEEQLDSEVQNFTSNVQLAAWKSTPNIKKTAVITQYPKDIRDLISLKRKLRSKWHQTRAPIDKTRLNKMTKDLSRKIKKFKNDGFSRYLHSLSNDRRVDYSLWKCTKYLKRPQMHCPPLKIKEGKWANNNSQKAELYADYLADIFTPHEATSESLSTSVLQEFEEIPRVTSAELKREIKMLKKKKSPGFDIITAEILKQLPPKSIQILTSIMNASFKFHYVPILWKTAEVIMLQKPGKPGHEVSSYRPISLLPVISKLFEKLLIKRLNKIIERKKIIPTHQFGFRSKHSTIDQVHRITHEIEKALENKKVCSGVFLDVAKAFDKVCHTGLLFKLKLILPKQYYEILESYLSDRYFRVKQDDAYSSLRQINAGVPQGSVLGPLLYLIFTHDLPSDPNYVTATFADDTALIAVGETENESTATLQTALNKICQWTNTWKIKLNQTKSVHVVFTNTKIQHIPLYIDDQQVPYSNYAKYLGMTLDCKLRWKEHVKKKRQELDIKLKNMQWLMGSRSALTIENKLLIYKQILRPVWSYGAQLWGCASQSTKNQIQHFQNKVLRCIVKAPWYCRSSDIERDLKINSVNTEIAKIAVAHKERLINHINEEALNLIETNGLIRRLRRTKPSDLIPP